MKIIEMDIEKEFLYKDNIKSAIKKVSLKYEEIIEDGKYQTIVYLPFSVKSSFTQTSYKDNLSQRALDIISSKLRQKYQDIQIRDYNNRYKFEQFKKCVGIEHTGLDFQYEYAHSLNHKSGEEVIGKMQIQKIWKVLLNDTKKKNYTEYLSAMEECPYPFELSWAKFIDIMLSSNCSYCGFSLKSIEKLKLRTKRSRGYSLEVDQINAYENYTDTNCTAACYWCNNAKTDEFNPSEFKEIARGINKVWNKRKTI